MKNSPKENPEIEPLPHTNPLEPITPEIIPAPEKTEPLPILPETEPLPTPEIEPTKDFASFSLKF